MNSFCITRLFLPFISLFLLQDSFAQKADIILTNGKVFTSDTAKLYVQALAIKGNKIMATGTNQEIRKLADAKTMKIDVAGKVIIPGFNDAHDHLAWLIPIGQSFFTEFSVKGPSKKEVSDSLSRLVKQASPGQWISGTIGLAVLRDTSIRRRFLDSIAPNNPVALEIMWGHGMILNSKALTVANISDTEPDPLSGWYERSPGTDHVTGALYEGAQIPLWQDIVVSEPDNLVAALRSHAVEQLAFGITTVQDLSGSLQGNAARYFFSKANLPVRTRVIAMPGGTRNGRNLEEWKDYNYNIIPLTYVSGIKYVIDGTPLDQTALMTQPYPDNRSWYGLLNFPIDTIKQILHEALTSDRQLLMHIVGDSSMKIVLGLMKQMATDEEWKSKRVRIEHGTAVRTQADAKIVSDLGIVIVQTPQYGFNVPLHSLVEMGVHVAMGPDAVINPFLGIMLVTTKQSNPGENLTREQAVIAYTEGSAYAEFAEKKKGVLLKGMLADVAVLSQDIFTIPSERLPATRSVLTMVDGKIVYHNKQSVHIKNK